MPFAEFSLEIPCSRVGHVFHHYRSTSGKSEHSQSTTLTSRNLYMPKYPLMEVCDREGNSPSPFANLKEDSSSNAADGKQPIWRTGSLDEGCRRIPSSECCDENQNDSSVVTALHSSFDASLLDDGQQDGEAIFRPTSAGKHARNAELDFVAPGTVRKLRRRSDLPPGPKNTPGRLSHGLRNKGSTTMGERTPTSAARRRRNRHAAWSRVPPTATPFKFQETTGASPATPRVSLFDSTAQQQSKSEISTPTRSAGLPLPATVVKKANTGQTATTVNTSFDGALNDSHETTSPTPFRFTSFPASLPRVNNPRNAGDVNYMCPPSTRKHMTFSSALDMDNGKGTNMNSSNEEDGTHNTSLSSLSAEAAQRETAAFAKPKALEWKSPEDATDMVNYRRKNSVDSDAADARLGAAASPVHTGRLFPDDDFAESPERQDSKMKVDFPLMSTKPHGEGTGVKYTFGNEKEHDVDLSRPYEQRKSSSFPSTASSTTPLRNTSTFEDGTIDSGMTPSGPAGMNMAEHPLSPELQVKFHFHVDATQCSPIPGIPEEDAMMDTDGPALDPASTLPTVKERPPLSAPRNRSQRRSGGSSLSSTRKGSTPSKESSKLSVSHESDNGTSSTTSSSKQRRLRPMPDMNAFDAGMSARSASSSRADSNSTDESSGTMMVSRPAPASPQLVCPPTPQRTPAWASYSDQDPQQKFTRQNSLVATKVLATCPSQVLDGHSSLENSLMEDDDEEIAEHEPLFGRKPAQPFSAVAEDSGGEEESPIRDLSGLNAMLDVDSSSALMPRLTRHAAAPVDTFSTLPAPLASHSNRFSGGSDSFRRYGSAVKTPAAASSRLSAGSFGEVGSVISFSADFENLGKLGSGAFADVYKVRSKTDQQLYAVKRNRRHFRGKRDREMAMAEVRIMQRLQSVCGENGTHSPDKKERSKNSYTLYLLFFLRAWQEDSHLFTQTELCCRDTCREMKVALGPQWSTTKQIYPSLSRHLPDGVGELDGRLIPESSVWKICHDVAAGLSHIHSHGVVHNDIKPSNLFLVAHNRLGALLKIGDFGIAGDIGTSDDGQEGDTSYMPPELLVTGTKRHPSADIFSLGLTLYELASNLSWELPSEGSRWQELRHGSHAPVMPHSRSPELGQLIQAMLNPDPALRPSADAILDQVVQVKEAGSRRDEFLRDYIKDIEEFDRVQEERLALEKLQADERYVVLMRLCICTCCTLNTGI